MSSSIDAPARLVFVSLLRNREDADGLSSFLEKALLPAQAHAVTCVTAPVRGLDFLADELRQEEVDAWWAQSVRPDAHPIYMLMYEPGLEQWTTGLDGTFYIGMPDDIIEPAYCEDVATRHFAADGPLEFAAAVMQDFSGTAPIAVFEPDAAQRIHALSCDIDVVAPMGGDPVPQTAAEHPFDLLVQAQSDDAVTPSAGGTVAACLAPPSAPPPGPPPAAVAPALDSARRLGPFTWPRRRGGPAGSPRELATAAVARGTTIVVMGSRKGGVGKTSHAAGVAIVAGEALDLFGHRAAIVDANIANPDAWGHLNLPAGAATVREVVAALAANREPPPPVHAASPALACYPESREATEYSKTDIGRFARLLRSRYTFIVVDMSNRLPDPLAGPEAAAAAYWLEHGDVLVLPTASSKADFNGVLDYLDVRGLPPTVVPYLVPGTRRNRDHPLTRRYLETIRPRVQSIVPMPDEADKVRYASMEGVPVQQVSPALRDAYRELFEIIVRVPPRYRL